MVQQLGIPTIFYFLSAGDTKWVNLLISLAKLIDDKTYLEADIAKMTWAQKSRLVLSHPAACAWFFNHRVQKFFKHVLQSPHYPSGTIQYYFYRVEFQHRGSPHIHGLAWIKETPKFDFDGDGDVCSYVDKIISCSSNVPESDLEFLQLQKHKHSKTCRKKVKGQIVCQFGAPWPPMHDTVIIQPLKDEDHQYMEKHKQTNKHIQKFLTDLKPEDYNITFDTFLHKLNVTEEEYITALRSSLNKAKIYLR